MHKIGELAVPIAILAAWILASAWTLSALASGGPMPVMTAPEVLIIDDAPADRPLAQAHPRTVR